MSEAKRSSLPGTGIDPELIANSILRRAFKEKIAVSPMKLQKLMFFITCLYQRNTGHRLLTESFQPWQYGPVCGAVYGEFKSFGGNPITEYAKDAMGNAYAADESSSPELKKSHRHGMGPHEESTRRHAFQNHPSFRVGMEQSGREQEPIRR